MFRTLKDKVKSEVSQEKIDKLVYSFDASNLEGKPYAIVWPETKEDIHKTILYAIRHHLTIVPRGAATGLVGGTIPTDSIVIDFSKMNRFQINEGYALVEPGVVLDDLNSSSDMFLPVIPSSYKVCTIGGMIATNAHGKRSVKYGRIDNWIEELEVFDGTGKNIKVRKENVSDFCGKEGTTGIIIKAKLKLTEKIQGNTLSVFSFDNIGSTIEKVKELKQDDITALEFLDKYTSVLAGFEEKNHLIVEYNNDEGQIDDKEEIKQIWEARDSIAPKLMSEGLTFIGDPKLEIDNLGKLLVWFKRNKIPCFGHIGTGIIHPHFKPHDLKIEEMFTLLKELNGDISGEHGIGLLKKKYISKEFAEKIRELKRKYDPNNILNRGKIINEI
jgi:glycolate oxidase/D-lactate dehydrogenase